MFPDKALEHVMNKKEFEQALRQKLRGVPLETRKKWKEIDLLGWFSTAADKDSYLRWKGGHGDPWQYVKGMCSDLIGEKAM